MLFQEICIVQNKCPTEIARQRSEWFPVEIVALYNNLKKIFLHRKNDKELIDAISSHQLTRTLLMMYIRIGDASSAANLVNSIAYKYFPMLRRKEKRFNNVILHREKYIEEVLPSAILNLFI